MKSAFSILVSLLWVLPAYYSASAQSGSSTSTYDFIPRERVIFEDNFESDSIGTFPKKWRIAAINKDYTTKKWFEVQKSVYGNILAMNKVVGVYSIEPDITPSSYLTDSFTLEFDFIIGRDRAGTDIQFFSPEGKGELKFAGGLYAWSDSNKMKFRHIRAMPTYNVFTSTISLPAAFSSWHHCAISYTKRRMKWYIDQYRVFEVAECGYSPEWFSLVISTSAYIKNVRLATGKENNQLGSLITDKKFVTHAINFDVNRSVIQPRSNAFLTQLAQFLKANPTIRLEIGGHTDSDGDADANIKLSQARADEVKKHLISLGIDANRLQAKGFGDKKPIKPNNTPQNKSENRRVEFIKL